MPALEEEAAEEADATSALRYIEEAPEERDPCGALWKLCASNEETGRGASGDDIDVVYLRWRPGSEDERPRDVLLIGGAAMIGKIWGSPGLMGLPG